MILIPPSGAEVKNQWSYTSTLLVCLHGLYTDSFTFSILFSICYHHCKDLNLLVLYDKVLPFCM